MAWTPEKIFNLMDLVEDNVQSPQLLESPQYYSNNDDEDMFNDSQSTQLSGIPDRTFSPGSSSLGSSSPGSSSLGSSSSGSSSPGTSTLESSSSNPTSPIASDPKTKKRKRELEEEAQISRCAKVAKRDEIDVYTEYLGSEIRSLPARDVSKFKKNVTDLLYEIKMANMNTEQQFSKLQFVDSEGNPLSILTGATPPSNQLDNAKLGEAGVADLTLHKFTD